MVMAQVLFKLLKAQDPDAIIDVAAPNLMGALVARMPEVRHFIPLPFAHGELNLSARYTIGQKLKQENYDQAIVLPNSFKSALIPFFAGIKTRTGFLGEMRIGLLNDWRRLDKTRYPLMIERFAALCDRERGHPQTLPWPQLNVAKESLQAALTRLNLTRPTTTKPLLALCPGAEYGPAKRWPTAYFAAVAREKLSRGWAVWIFGSVKEQSLAAEIQQHCNHACVDLTGKTKLDEAIDLLSCSDVVLTNDSGLMHMAAALQRKLVVIYGSSSPQFTPPLSNQVEILSLQLSCSPCFERACPLGHFNCLKQLEPPMVLSAIDRLMAHG